MSIDKINLLDTPNTGRLRFNALIDLITSTGYIVTGTGAPSDSNGDDGTYYLDKTTGDLYQKSAGTWGAAVANLAGPTGATGPAGTDGATWRSGPGAPANSLGDDGDYYLDTATGDVYLKAAGAYALEANIEGPTGPQGPAGDDGATWRSGSGAPANTLGVDGDYYLDNDTGDVYLKAAGSYALETNIEGPGDMDTSVYDVDSDGIVDQAEELHDGVDTVTAAQARTHIDSVANPHNVTPAQIAAVLADLTNVVITSPADDELLAYNTGTGNWINQTPAEAGVATAADLTAHEGDQTNPHVVTKIQVGLGNVTNDQQVPKAGGAFDGSVDWATGEPTVGLNPVVDSDSNTNGSWVRYYDGTQIVWDQVTLPYHSAEQLKTTWTFPKEFINNDLVMSGWIEGDYTFANATPTLNDLMMLSSSLSTTSAIVFMRRVTGTTDFVSGDSGLALVTARGRWY